MIVLTIEKREPKKVTSPVFTHSVDKAWGFLS